MKIQNLGFFAIFSLVLILNKPWQSVIFGIGCLVLAIPFFAKWILFTAERLTWYAAAFFLLAITQILWRVKNENRH